MTHFRFFLSEKASHKGTVACAGGWNGPYVPLKRRTRSSETSGKMSIVVSRLATYSISVGKIPYRVAAGSAMALLIVVAGNTAVCYRLGQSCSWRSGES